MPSSRLKFLFLLAPLAVGACDGNYERISGIVPYVMERTAGTGVAYVRGHMLQEKTLKVEQTAPAPAAAAPEPIKSAEPVFQKQQSK
jgi:hypothetical protein